MRTFLVVKSTGAVHINDIWHVRNPDTFIVQATSYAEAVEKIKSATQGSKGDSRNYAVCELLPFILSS